MNTRWISALICCLSATTLWAEETDTRLIRGVSYVGVAVSDLDAAVAFFTDACDLETVSESRLENLDVLDSLAGRTGVAARSAMLQGNNAQLRLMQFDAPSQAAQSTVPVPVEGPGFMHVCFQVLAERRTYQRVLEAGSTTIGDPEMAQLNPRRTVFYAYVNDPDGRVIEVEHIDRGDRGDGKLRSATPKVRHLCATTPDIERQLSFYSAFLNKNPRRVGPTSGKPFDMVSGHPETLISMAWYPIGNFELEVSSFVNLPTQLPDAPRPLDAIGYNMLVFDVTDVDAAAERLTEAGGTIVTERTTMDGGDIIFGRDPDGNLIGLFDAPEDSLMSSTRF